VVDIPVPHHHQDPSPIERVRLVPCVARLLIVENDPRLRHILSASFSGAPDIEVLGSITASDSTASAAQGLHADTVLLGLPDVDSAGLLAIHHVATAEPACRVLVFTGDDRGQAVLGALGAAASAYLVEGDAPDLPQAVRVVALGSVLLSPTAGKAAAAALTDLTRPEVLPPAGSLAALTPQRRRVLELLAAGRSNAEIASFLDIAVPTVKFHVSHLLHQLGQRDRKQLMAYAHRNGVTGADPTLSEPAVP